MYSFEGLRCSTLLALRLFNMSLELGYAFALPSDEGPVKFLCLSHVSLIGQCTVDLGSPENQELLEANFVALQLLQAGVVR